MSATASVGVGDGGNIVRCDAGVPWGGVASPTPSTLRGVSAVPTVNHVYAAGDGGTILRSVDAGATWAVQDNGAAHYNAISMIVAGGVIRGMAVGQNGAVKIYNGVAWAPSVYPWPHHLLGVALAANPNVGQGWEAWIVGSPIANPNGGIISRFSGAWAPAGLPPNSPRLNSVSAWAWDLLVAGAQGGKIYRKAAAGGWAPVVTPVGTGNLYGIAMVDANNGFSVGEAGAILGSADGGMNWAAQVNPMPGPCPALRSVAGIGTMPAYAMGDLVAGAADATLLENS